MSEIQSFREIQEDEVDIQQHPLYLADQLAFRSFERLELFEYSELKEVWYGQVRETQEDDVVDMQLEHPLYLADKLEKLDIESCGVEEIVAIEEGSEELNFHFAQLTILRLVSLTKLKSFYRENHTLECPSLKTLNVFLCEALQIFSFDHLDSQQTIEVGEADLPIHQALFYVEKVSLNLTDLSLNEKDAMRILNGHCEKNLFTGIEILYLQYFQETPVTFLDDLLENFPNTTTLLVRYSSFDTLFPSDEIGQCSNEGPTQINSLWLFELKQLKNIWNDDSLSNPIAEILEDLSVWVCPSLMRLAPPSISFKNLTNLEVKDCKGLIYLMTSSTAKSLVHLESLKIKNCEMIEDVVRIDEGESEEEMVFESLEDLRLTSLLSFKSFCSGNLTFVFPSLVQLKVRGCPKMQNFSSGVTLAPFLKTVEVENGKMRWKEDLNTTIQQLFMEKKSHTNNHQRRSKNEGNASSS
ncbi:putative P-loop containing nucleoside triphosphate hydrolase, leucine-rich repeat domain, L [Senna tora]|uniref:Putative P-loop containing nucleoside triphosphate hydrolase, leucine-rich repeat domain, L n=1 Tax=Senna tora TaxID=362788 RepID=A0A834WJR8_9FABA|nr:putative P-loop containing nucleoside triphosphate hydrolase, leucine-rich repeat domain, L [Senna tora]